MYFLTTRIHQELLPTATTFLYKVFFPAEKKSFLWERSDYNARSFRSLVNSCAELPLFWSVWNYLNGTREKLKPLGSVRFKAPLKTKPLSCCHIISWCFKEGGRGLNNVRGDPLQPLSIIVVIPGASSYRYICILYITMIFIW